MVYADTLYGTSMDMDMLSNENMLSIGSQGMDVWLCPDVPLLPELPEMESIRGVMDPPSSILTSQQASMFDDSFMGKAEVNTSISGLHVSRCRHLPYSSISKPSAECIPEAEYRYLPMEWE
jgi:hypothetical protein